MDAGAEPLLKEFEVPSADTVAEQEEFLAQMANHEDASTVQQPELDLLVTLLHSKILAGEDIKELLDRMQEQAVQKALVAAALQQPTKRKYTSAWAFPAGSDAGKRRLFTMSSGNYLQHRSLVWGPLHGGTSSCSPSLAPIWHRAQTTNTCRCNHTAVPSSRNRVDGNERQCLLANIISGRTHFGDPGVRLSDTGVSGSENSTNHSIT